MELTTGSEFKKLVAVGERINPETGAMEKVTNFYPSYHYSVIKTFELYPVHQRFGITVKSAMELPVHEWYAIRKLVESMPPERNETEDMLIKLVQSLTTAREGGG